MIDQERCREDQEPAAGKETIDCSAEDRIADVPDGAPHRLPGKEEQQQGQAGEEHLGAAFDRLWDKPRPPLFEFRAGHHAMLRRKKTQEEHIDQQR